MSILTLKPHKFYLVVLMLLFLRHPYLYAPRGEVVENPHGSDCLWFFTDASTVIQHWSDESDIS